VLQVRDRRVLQCELRELRVVCVPQLRELRELRERRERLQPQDPSRRNASKSIVKVLFGVFSFVGILRFSDLFFTERRQTSLRA
jgi:hypothetical protein